MFGLGSFHNYSLLAPVKEIWSETLPTVVTALTPVPKLMAGHCLGKQKGAALCWTLRVSTQAYSARHFLYPLPLLSTLQHTLPPEPWPSVMVLCTTWNCFNGMCGTGDWPHMHMVIHTKMNARPWPWERMKIWSGKTQQGAFGAFN